MFLIIYIVLNPLVNQGLQILAIFLYFICLFRPNDRLMFLIIYIILNPLVNQGLQILAIFLYFICFI